MRVFNWVAKRSGANMTVQGRDGDGKEVKLTPVTSIFPKDGKIIARVKETAVIGLPAKYVEHLLMPD